MRWKVVDETEEKVESRCIYGTPEENAKITLAILNGEKKNGTLRKQRS